MNPRTEARLIHVQKRIAAIRALLEEHPADIRSLTAPGLNTRFDRKQAIDELAELEIEEKRLLGEYNPADAIQSFKIRGNSMR